MIFNGSKKVSIRIARTKMFLLVLIPKADQYEIYSSLKFNENEISIKLAGNKIFTAMVL